MIRYRQAKSAILLQTMSLRFISSPLGDATLDKPRKMRKYRDFSGFFHALGTPRRGHRRLRPSSLQVVVFRFLSVRNIQNDIQNFWRWDPALERFKKCCYSAPYFGKITSRLIFLAWHTVTTFLKPLQSHTISEG